MVDKLDSKDIYNAPRFRSLLRFPDIETSVALIMPVVPTSRSSISSLSAESEPPPRTDGRPSMMSILAGAPKKKGAPAAEPIDRVLRSSETKSMSLMEEMMAKKLKKV